MAILTLAAVLMTAGATRDWCLVDRVDVLEFNRWGDSPFKVCWIFWGKDGHVIDWRFTDKPLVKGEKRLRGILTIYWRPTQGEWIFLDGSDGRHPPLVRKILFRSVIISLTEQDKEVQERTRRSISERQKLKQPEW